MSFSSPLITLSNRRWHDDTLAYIGLTLQKIMTSSQLGHTAKVYGFISTTIYPITTKFDNMVMMLSQC